jgi:uncharacterized protein (DUF433 family)
MELDWSCDNVAEAKDMSQEIARGITIDPEVMVGKPVVKGTRMPVELVLAKLAVDPSLDELFADYPELTIDQVKDCLNYATALVQESRGAGGRKLPAQAAHPPAV